MGSTRFLLALSVVIMHSYGFLLVGGQLAVQLFYVTSGYLISLILITNTTYKNTKRFYLNRFLRLFPIYWLIAVISLIFKIATYYQGTGNFFQVYDEVGLIGSVFLIISNLILIGQDWVMFTGVENGFFGLSSSFNQSEVLVYEGLLVPQAWTLGVEISFYLIAPFILRHKRRWLTLLFISLILRAYLIYIGIGQNDPFSYRFFPTELALFLIGAFSHQFFLPMYNKHRFLQNTKLVNGISFFLMTFIIFFSFISLARDLLSIIMIIVFALSLPFLASFQKNNKFDQWLGNLSYPIYICHMLIIGISSKIANVFDFYNTISYYSMIIFLTLLFAYWLEIYVSQRVDKIRYIVKQGNSIN
jgi:peptidoglycan/LPS O-acetylase OafA/YrhL